MYQEGNPLIMGRASCM